MNQLNQNLKDLANHLPSWQLNDRQICDLELILNGSFNPLGGFLDKKNYDNVLKEMRLTDGSLWPIPITLDVSSEFVSTIENAEKIALRDKEGFVIALLTIDDIWKPDFEEESMNVFGTTDQKHPGVDYLYNISHKNYIGGSLEKISDPLHYDHKSLRHSPNQIKKIFTKKGWENIIAFQTRNPLHKAHYELTKQAMNELNANLFLHPVVGMTKPGDVNHYTRTRCYKHIMKEYPKNSAMLSLLPLAMRMGGPKEALLHAIIRKNYGCTHLIVGRDHAGPGLDLKINHFMVLMTPRIC